MIEKKPSKRKMKPEVLVAVIVAIIALIGTIGAAVISNMDKIWPNPNPSSASVPQSTIVNTPQSTVANTPQPPPSATPINISGKWRDQYGYITHIIQRGNTVTTTSNGYSCKLLHFNSTGSGTIIGNILEFTYQSTDQAGSPYSTGWCRGTISQDGMRITAKCDDSVCGEFPSTSVKLE